MFFNLIKEVNNLRKEINRLLSKAMLNIYLKTTVEEKWRTQNFDFLSLKNSSPDEILGSTNTQRYYLIFKLLVAT